MSREQLITAMHDAFCAAPPDGAARWGAVADIVSTDPEVIARLDGERTDRLAAQSKRIAELEAQYEEAHAASLGVASLRGVLDGIANSIDETLAHEITEGAHPLARKILGDLAVAARKAAGP